jgi:hypothetical protein
MTYFDSARYRDTEIVTLFQGGIMNVFLLGAD